MYNSLHIFVIFVETFYVKSPCFFLFKILVIFLSLLLNNIAFYALTVLEITAFYSENYCYI
jgi:hypothetical protein